MKKYKFLVTATVQKTIEVEIDPEDWGNEEEMGDAARDLAHELFSINHDGTEEYYSEDAHLVAEE